MSEKIERMTSLALSTVLTVAVVVMIGLVVYRDVFAGGSRSRSLTQRPPQFQFDTNWHSALKNAVVVGNRESPVKLVEFIDFECPVCRAAHEAVIKDLERHYGSQLSVWYIHYPLAFHRFARVAAQAAECADSAARFDKFVDVVFAKQDSLGLKSWGSYGAEIGVADTAAFVKCVAKPSLAARIDSGLATGRRSHVTGTPTFIINGWQFEGVLAATDMVKAIDAVLAGRKPVGS